MTIKEFTNRTDLAVTEEQFEEIHTLYMMLTCDKDEFCAGYKKMYKEPMFAEMAKVVNVQADNIERHTSVALKLVEKAYKSKDEELRIILTSILNERRIIMLAIENDWELFRIDRDYIRRNLK